MNTRLSVLALSAIIIASIGLAPAFGQIANPIVVTTDKPSYLEGDTIIVTGEVKELLSGYPVSLRVIAPNGNIVTVDQLDVGADRKYSTELTAGGALMRASGTYTIAVLYGTEARTAETTFEYGGSSGEIPGKTIAVAGTDFMLSYSITGGRVLSVTPDLDAKSLIIAIDATSDGTLTITLPRALIDAKIADQDDDFFVLVDMEENTTFTETKTDTDRTLTIDFPAGATEIEIIGTFVVPEFGTIAALILVVAIASIIAVTARSRLGIMPKY